jgi:RimJ/RimL family protein N-acetyltransferase
MITLEIPQTPEENFLLGQWVEKRIPGMKFNSFQAMAFFKAGTGILAVVLYHNWRGTDIEVVFAADDKAWATRGPLTAAINYPFTIGCQRITALARKDNRKVRKLLEQLGFKKEGKLRRAERDGTDLLIYGLLPEEYRLDKRKDHGWKVSTVAAAAA